MSRKLTYNELCTRLKAAGYKEFEPSHSDTCDLRLLKRVRDGDDRLLYVVYVEVWDFEQYARRSGHQDMPEPGCRFSAWLNRGDEHEIEIRTGRMYDPDEAEDLLTEIYERLNCQPDPHND